MKLGHPPKQASTKTKTIDVKNNKTLVRLVSPTKQVSTKTKRMDAKINKKKLGTKRKYVALMHWSSVCNFPFLKTASRAFMAGDRNQEILLRDLKVSQFTVRRRWKNQNIVEDGINFEHVTRNMLYM